jgi:hypothetical protein
VVLVGGVFCGVGSDENDVGIIEMVSVPPWFNYDFPFAAT